MHLTKRNLWRLASVLLLLSIVATPARADEVDRLLAAVNARVITERDLGLARNLNALIVFGRSEAAQPREHEIERLIDLEILRQELGNASGLDPAPEKVDAALRDLQNAYAELGGLNGLLARLGLESGELHAYLVLQLAVDNLIASRFRPFVTATSEEQHAYYRDRLVPRLEHSGAERVPSLDEVAPEVARIVIEEKVTAALEAWLRDVRRHTRIEHFTGPAFPGEVLP